MVDVQREEHRCWRRILQGCSYNKLMTLKQGKETGSLKLTRPTTSPRGQEVILVVVWPLSFVKLASGRDVPAFPGRDMVRVYLTTDINPSLSLSPSNPNRLFNTA